jgi:hypothetical protein
VIGIQSGPRRRRVSPALPLPTYTYARAKVRLPEIARRLGAAAANRPAPVRGDPWGMGLIYAHFSERGEGTRSLTGAREGALATQPGVRHGPAKFAPPPTAGRPPRTEWRGVAFSRRSAAAPNLRAISVKRAFSRACAHVCPQGGRAGDRARAEFDRGRSLPRRWPCVIALDQRRAERPRHAPVYRRSL